MYYRGVINGKAGKAAALPKFSNALTLSQPGEQIMPTHWLCLTQKNSVITPLAPVLCTYMSAYVLTYMVQIQRRTNTTFHFKLHLNVLTKTNAWIVVSKVARVLLNFCGWMVCLHFDFIILVFKIQISVNFSFKALN